MIWRSPSHAFTFFGLDCTLFANRAFKVSLGGDCRVHVSANAAKYIVRCSTGLLLGGSARSARAGHDRYQKCPHDALPEPHSSEEGAGATSRPKGSSIHPCVMCGR